MKKCSKCGVEKEPAEFYIDRCKRDGISCACRDCENRRTAAFRRANPKKILARNAKWQKENPELFRAQKARWRANNKAHLAAYNAAWVISNRAKHNAKSSRRRAAELQATPAWANKNYIEDCYAQAAIRTKRDGVPWHVDHIVPLKSPLVCGLHWEENLQVIPGRVNQQKHNRVWPDMPAQGVRP